MDPYQVSSGDKIVGGVLVNPADPQSKRVVEIMTTGGSPAKAKFCTGSFLTEKIVLTAAHCLKEYSSGKVRIKLSEKKSESRQIENVVIYPLYATDPLNSDMALLFLKEPFEFPVLISKLPATDMHLKPEQVSVLGYGLVSGIAAQKPKRGLLFKAQLPVIRFSFAEPVFLTDETQGLSTCHGDSGGPLYAAVNGESYLVGIVKGGRITKQDDLPLEQQDRCKGKGRSINLQYPDHLAWLNSHLAANAPLPSAVNAKPAE